MLFHYQVDGDLFGCLSWGENHSDGVTGEGTMDLLIGDVKAGIGQASSGILINQTIFFLHLQFVELSSSRNKK